MKKYLEKDAMPKSPAFLLLWNVQQKCYELHVQNHLERRIEQGDEAWWACWLNEHTSFSFHGQHGRVAVRKEARQRGKGYWYAYHTHGKHTRKQYLGRTSQITIPHLEETATRLIQSFHDNKSKAVGPASVSKHLASTTSLPDSADPITVSTAPAQMPLLAPKLQLPRLSSALIARERLLNHLDRALEGSLTLLSAPAGYGKTTLVRQWINKRQANPKDSFSMLAWVSLDSADNDPLRFWRYIADACHCSQPAQNTLSKLADGTLPLRKPALPDLLNMLVTDLLNALVHLPSRGILVLEDYHVLTSSLLHTSVAFFLEHLPPTLHVILLSRTEPPLPLARLLASGNMYMLSAMDLCFSPQETRIFLRQALSLSIPDHTLQQLDTRLQGWPTGLRLLSLSLHADITDEDFQQALTRLEGGQRPLLDYFVSEVLSVQPEPLQDFLLQTCMLGRMNDSLCNAATGREDSELFLDAIERTNLFLERLDGPERWYRYHTLFAEAMQRVVVLRFGEAYLHQQAELVSYWYEQHGQLASAIEAAIAAANNVRVADLVEQFIQMQRALQPTLYMQNVQEFHTLYRWLNYLPDEIIRARPLLCFTQATALFLVGILEQRPFSSRDITAMQDAFQQAVHGFRLQGDTNGQSLALALHATVMRQFGNITDAALKAQQALELLPVQDMIWKSSCMNILGAKELFIGQIERAIQRIVTAREYYMELGAPNLIRANTVLLCKAYFERGELHLAASLYRQMLLSARQEQDYDDIGDAQLGLSQISYEWNDLTSAQQQATEALEMGKLLANEECQVEAELVLVRVEQAQHKSTAAQEHCMTLLAHYPTTPTTLPGSPLRIRLQKEIQAMQFRFQLASGDLAAGERWSRNRNTSENTSLLQNLQEKLLLTRLLLAQQNSTQAREIAEHVSEEAEKVGLVRIALEAQLLVSLAYSCAQQMQLAQQKLQHVVAQAAFEGYLRLFLDEGEPLATLLQALLPSIRESARRVYVRRIMLAFVQQRGEQLPVSTESLSTQEKRVLRLLTAGRTNLQIADELIVSVNTVKTQVQSIYRKLDVKNRVEASEVTRSLHLF